MQEESLAQPDLADRATAETDRSLELRTRDRFRKLISKIESALKSIEEGTYGCCEETGEPIALKRLEARPIATLSVEAQERHERMERTRRDEGADSRELKGPLSRGPFLAGARHAGLERSCPGRDQSGRDARGPKSLSVTHRLRFVLHLLAVEGAAGAAAAGLAVAPRDGAVAQHGVDAGGRHHRLLERRRVDHRRRIEDAEVSVIAGLHLAALGQVEARAE